MFDSGRLAAHFGVEQQESHDGHLLLQGKIRLFFANDKLVLISDGARRYSQIPAPLWQLAGAEPHAHLLITRSGDIALQLSSSDPEQDQTDWAAATISSTLPVLVDLV